MTVVRGGPPLVGPSCSRPGLSLLVLGGADSGAEAIAEALRERGRTTHRASSLADVMRYAASSPLTVDAVVAAVGRGPDAPEAVAAQIRGLPAELRAGRLVAVAAPGAPSLGRLDALRRLTPIIFEDVEDEARRARLVDRLTIFAEAAQHPTNPFLTRSTR